MLRSYFWEVLDWIGSLREEQWALFLCCRRNRRTRAVKYRRRHFVISLVWRFEWPMTPCLSCLTDVRWFLFKRTRSAMFQIFSRTTGHACLFLWLWFAFLYQWLVAPAKANKLYLCPEWSSFRIRCCFKFVVTLALIWNMVTLELLAYVEIVWKVLLQKFCKIFIQVPLTDLNLDFFTYLVISGSYYLFYVHSGLCSHGYWLCDLVSTFGLTLFM